MEKLEWQGPWKVTDQLTEIPDFSGVYIWTAEIQKKKRIFYIGSSALIRKRIVEEVEENLGGRWWFLDWDDPSGPKWIPDSDEMKKQPMLTKRVLRAQMFLVEERYRNLALRRMTTSEVFCVKTDRYKEVERKLITIALDQQESDGAFRWIENIGRYATREAATPLKIQHAPGPGAEWVCNAFKE